METDKTTLADLGIFDRDDEFSVFSKINLTVTGRGKEQLRKYLSEPLPDITAVSQVQQSVIWLHRHTAHWPQIISNGTLMVVERFFDANIDPIPTKPSPLTAMTYKLLHGHDYSLVKYSVRHLFDFIKGMKQAVTFFLNDGTPLLLKKDLEEAEKIIGRPELSIIATQKTAGDLKPAEMLAVARFIRYSYRRNISELVSIFSRLDARHAMALAMEKYNLVMPEFNAGPAPLLRAYGLYHLMLTRPVPYNVQLTEAGNFLFLTGANMAGKSTFIKACGSAVYMAHVGMAVPAATMTLSYFDGLLSNINVIDNIAKGESYFFNEVQRIKSTIQKLSNGKKWLILIDELFKGTNVQDAMKCSAVVIEGLVKMDNAVFILSTHLYEIGEELRQYPNISFSYFETAVKDERLNFSYQLKEGISNDRLGYLILKQEGVVKMLEDLQAIK